VEPLLQWKINNTYSGGMYVALGIQHASRMHNIVLCAPFGSTVFFHIIS
jgi:hypothetical protein